VVLALAAATALTPFCKRGASFRLRNSASKMFGTMAHLAGRHLSRGVYLLQALDETDYSPCGCTTPTQTNKQVVENPPQQSRRADFSPDGNYIYFVPARGSRRKHFRSLPCFGARGEPKVIIRTLTARSLFRPTVRTSRFSASFTIREVGSGAREGRRASSSGPSSPWLRSTRRSPNRVSRGERSDEDGFPSETRRNVTVALRSRPEKMDRSMTPSAFASTRSTSANREAGGRNAKCVPSAKK